MLSKSSAFLTIIALVLLTSSLSAQKIDWKTDLDQAKQVASREGKLVLLHFYADWCGPCQQLDTFVFNRESVSRTVSEGMVPVKVDIDVHPDLVSEYGVKSIPFDVIISPNGNMVHRQKSPATSDNYQNMIARLNKVNSRSGQINESIDPSMFNQKIAQQEAAQKINQVDSMQFNTSSVGFRPSNQDVKLGASDGQFRPRSQTGPSTEARTMGTIDFVSNQNARDKQSRFQAQSTTNDFVTNTQATDQAAKSDFSPRPQRVVNEIAASSMSADQLQEPIFSPGSIRTEPARANARIRTGNKETIKPETEVAQPTRPQTIANTKPAAPAPRETFALNGNCPVSLLTISKWVPGNEKFGCVHRGKTYLFASREHMDTFLAAPDKYSPVLAGYDPVAFSENGEFNDGEESLGVFMSKGGVQKIVLFESMENRKKFQEDPKRYLEAVRVATEQIDGGNDKIRR